MHTAECCSVRSVQRHETETQHSPTCKALVGILASSRSSTGLVAKTGLMPVRLRQLVKSSQGERARSSRPVRRGFTQPPALGGLEGEGETAGRKVTVHLLTFPEPPTVTAQHGGPPAGRRAAWLAEAPDSPHDSGCSFCPRGHVDGARRSKLLLSSCLLTSYPHRLTPCNRPAGGWSVGTTSLVLPQLLGDVVHGRRERPGETPKPAGPRSRRDPEAGGTQKPARPRSRRDPEAGETPKPARPRSRRDPEAGETQKPARPRSRRDPEAGETQKPAGPRSRRDPEAGGTQKPAGPRSRRDPEAGGTPKPARPRSRRLIPSPSPPPPHPHAYTTFTRRWP
ncbi:uncharacterized protein FLJ40521-like [Mustela erminea]|uniref:uncharacterized protein FLJ40521-like n=1 Tax=Mustela erminea TaxID=36723 RepID=UPI0013869B1A|nr:uncharacterized protein FLJ40521-like [Mustela erminea]